MGFKLSTARSRAGRAGQDLRYAIDGYRDVLATRTYSAGGESLRTLHRAEPGAPISEILRTKRHNFMAYVGRGMQLSRQKREH